MTRKNYVDEENGILYRMDPRRPVCCEARRVENPKTSIQAREEAKKLREMPFVITRVNRELLVRCLEAFGWESDVVMIGLSKPRGRPDDRVILLGNGEREFYISPCVPINGDDAPERV